MPKSKQATKQSQESISQAQDQAQSDVTDHPLPEVPSIAAVDTSHIDPTLVDLDHHADQSRTKLVQNGPNAQAGPVDGPSEGLGAGLAQLDELDPDWSEIVNSLNQASQTGEGTPVNLDQSQAGPSDEASHLAEHEERDRLQQSLQTTFEHFTEENLSALFPAGFPQSPPASQFGLGPEDASRPIASTSTLPVNGDDPVDTSPGSSTLPMRRGRGRPKGSKNKFKATSRPRKPRKKSSPVPKRPRGRPPKVRTPEEQVALEEKRARQQLGIKLQKGRPRKFPGFLVREMRLRKNRDEYIQLMKEYEEAHPGVQPTRRRKNKAAGGEGMFNEEDEVRRALEGQAFNLDQALEGQTATEQTNEEVDGIFTHPWETQGQSLLEVVDAAAAAEAARQAEEGGGPSGHNEQAVEDMQRVFRLDGDGDETMGLEGVVEEVEPVAS